VGGDFGLKIGFASTPVMENVSFQNASWGSRPDMVRVKRVEVQAAIPGATNRDRLFVGIDQLILGNELTQLRQPGCLG
jgi:hypothetical protein